MSRHIEALKATRLRLAFLRAELQEVYDAVEAERHDALMHCDDGAEVVAEVDDPQDCIAEAILYTNSADHYIALAIEGIEEDQP